MKPSLTFWYDLASPYSWLSAERIETLAAQARIAVAWRPFLLGPIFAAHGWSNSPFNLFPAKGRNMWRDLERLCAKVRLPQCSAVEEAFGRKVVNVCGPR